MKDNYSTKMVEFHLGTKNCVQTEKQVLDESYAAFVCNIEQLKKRDGLDRVSYRRLDRYLWFAGKYRFFLKKPPFEKGGRPVQIQSANGQQNAPEDITKQEFLGSLDVPEYTDDLAAVLGD
jgi:hypothetical protein